MQNLTAEEKYCGLCVRNTIFRPTALPYVLLSLPANGWVMWLMVSSPVFWTDRMEVSEFHLVFTELLFGFFGPPLMIMGLFSSYEVAEILDKLTNIIIVTRIQFQTAICIERYLAVVHPVLYLRYKALRYRMSFCCGIWLLTLLLGTVQMFYCSENVETVSMLTAHFLLVFIIKLFCCASVLRALRKPSPGDGDREGSNLIKRRAFNIVLIFQVNTFISYVPLITMFFLIRKIWWDTVCVVLPLTYTVITWLGAIHPLLYLRRSKKMSYFCKLFSAVYS